MEDNVIECHPVTHKWAKGEIMNQEKHAKPSFIQHYSRQKYFCL